MVKGKKVALLVGVGKYGSGLKPLQCPANGVTELQAILANPEIGGFDQVIPLIHPDVGTMRSHIGEVFSGLSKQDLVLFYFTGHGIKDMTGEFYLTTSQTQLFNNGRHKGRLNPGTAVEASFVKTVMGNCYAQRKVIILDCCFGAAFAEGFLTMDDGRVDVKDQLGGEGWVVLTAATARNYALEQEGEPLSVYTRYLVEGLKTGAAAREGQAQITIGHLHDYVRGKVKTAAPSMEPAIFNGYQGEDILLAQAVVNPELTYRQKVQTKIRRGRIGAAGRRFLAEWQQKLDILPERAQAIEAEVLRPYVEKQRHLDLYVETLREEIEEEFPLSPGTINDLKDLQKLWSLRDQDVEPLMRTVLQERGLDREEMLVAVMLQPDLDRAGTAPATPVKKPSDNKLLTYPPFDGVRVDNRGKIVERWQEQAQYFVENLGNGVSLEMVAIPAGKFTMGAPAGEQASNDDEKPQHRVTVPAFFVGKYPITQAQYQAVTGQNPSDFTKNGANRPVEQVSWDDAVAFCEALSAKIGRTYRLPSEAEWEYACRARTETPFYFGPTITPELANYDGNSTYDNGPKGAYREQTTEVGQFPPNRFGLYDMHGNVWEWCQDVWHDNYDRAPVDGSAWLKGGDQSYRLLRGGSWPDVPRYCRSAYRYYVGPGIPLHYGFRVVCSPE